MIVYLLAILELYHEKRLRIEQNAAFSSIYIFARTPEEEDAEPQLADPAEIDLGEPAPVPGPLAQVIEVGAAAEDDEETFET